MVAEQFNIAKDELLLSLADGNDLEFNAAEYIIAWESLEKAPSDNLLKSLKNTAETIIIAKKEVDEKTTSEITEVGQTEGPGLLLAHHHTHGEPTNHVWKNQLAGADGIKESHAVWPRYDPSPSRPYKAHNFPFHHATHPLLKMDAETGNAAYVENLRSHIFGGHAKEETKMEQEFQRHLQKKKSPLVEGHNGKKILGSLKTNKSNHAHQIDLYHRDYQRWSKLNTERKDNYISEGRSAEEAENRLKVDHFNQRAKQWQSDSYVTDENGDKHAVGLGQEGYHLGLEWLNPEERTAVMRHISEKGVDAHDTIKLPNGEHIPSARLTWNNLMRRTPEMNWAVREAGHNGPRSHLRQESNKEDYPQEENRFNQSAIGEAAHTYDIGGKPISHYIAEAIHNRHGIEDGIGNQFNILPRLNLHKSSPKESYSLHDLHLGTNKHYKKKKIDDPKNARMPMEDVLFLAGYDPKTRKPLLNHPIYGEMDGPIIPLHELEEMESHAKENGNLDEKAKDVRNDLAFLQSPHGPHPDEEKPKHWQLGKGGNHTVGPAKFWSKPFAQYGGAGMTLATYNEIIHSVAHNEDELTEEEKIEQAYKNIASKEPVDVMSGAKPSKTTFQQKTKDTSFPSNSSMFELNNEGILHPNDMNTALGMHFGPEKSRQIGEFGDAIEGEKARQKFTYFNDAQLMQNHFSPVNHTSRRGDKHNWTLHKSTYNPDLQYTLRHMSADEKSKLKSVPHNDSSLVHHPLKSSLPESTYGAHSSDTPILNKARSQHWRKTMLGHTNDPYKPQKPSVQSLTDLVSGNVPVSYGVDHEDYMDFMGWGSKNINFKNVKNYITSKESAKNMRILTAIAKQGGNNSPTRIHKVIDNLEEDNDDPIYADVKNHLETSGSTLNEGDLDEFKNWLNGFEFELRKKKGEAAKAKNQEKRTSIEPTADTVFNTSTIDSALKFGGMLPAMEKETQLSERLNQITEQMQYAESPEEIEAMRQELYEGEAELNKIQNRSTEAVIGKKSSWWNEKPKITDKIAKSSRKAVLEAAGKLLPMVMEHDPNHFDLNDPEKFMANHQRLMHDAERWISNSDNDAHGINASVYRIQDEMKQVKPKQSGFHRDVMSHILDNGFELNGNMSPDEVLEGMGLEGKTSEQKSRLRDHVQQLIDESNAREVPLNVSTVGQLLTSDKFKNLMLHRTHADEEFADDYNEHGLHGAVDNAQSRYANWKAHPIHGVAGNAARQFDSKEFGGNMQNNGLDFYSANDNDVHNRKNAGKGNKKPKTRQTKNHLDSIVSLDVDRVNEDNLTPKTEIVRRVGVDTEPVPIGGVNPSSHGIMLTHTGADVVHSSAVPVKSSFGFEFDAQGQPTVGTFTEPQLYHPTWQGALEELHGTQETKQLLESMPPHPNPTPPFMDYDKENFEIAGENNPTALNLSEMSEYITSLLNPDVLLTKSEDAEWVPPVRPMHRIFDLSDLEHLRGFSGSWVVSKWYDGKRVIIVQNDNEVTTYDENGRKVGLKKAFKESLAELNDNNFVIDGIVGKEDLNIIDIINYDDTNVAEMLMHERMKVLRGQFDSHENVIIPGPHDTKMTDDEGLEEAVKILQEEHSIVLLRDNKSTYMKGERRHPKWLLLRKSRDFNFIVLDRRGKGPFTYQLGAGPIIDGEALGNRAVTYKNQFYMDVGTAHNQQRTFKVGDIIRATVTGVTKKQRKNRNVYNVQVREIESEGEGEGAASAESLDLMTKSFAPILIPHDLEYNDGVLQVILKGVDTVSYQVSRIEDNWYLHNPSAALGDLTKSNYSLTLAESLHPYWHSVAPLILEGHLVKSSVMDEEEIPTREQQEDESAGILEEKDNNRLLKPSTKKALEVISRALDQLAKEKLTWTGPKGLGIDMATPIESPSGPTRLTEESNLPDYDGKKRPDEEERDVNSGDKAKKTITHIEMKTDEDESIVLDDEDGTPTLSV